MARAPTLSIPPTMSQNNFGIHLHRARRSFGQTMEEKYAFSGPSKLPVGNSVRE